MLIVSVIAFNFVLIWAHGFLGRKDPLLKASLRIASSSLQLLQYKLFKTDVDVYLHLLERKMLYATSLQIQPQKL